MPLQFASQPNAVEWQKILEAVANEVRDAINDSDVTVTTVFGTGHARTILLRRFNVRYDATVQVIITMPKDKVVAVNEHVQAAAIEGWPGIANELEEVGVALLRVCACTIT